MLKMKQEQQGSQKYINCRRVVLVVLMMVRQVLITLLFHVKEKKKEVNIYNNTLQRSVIETYDIYKK